MGRLVLLSKSKLAVLESGRNVAAKTDVLANGDCMSVQPQMLKRTH